MNRELVEKRMSFSPIVCSTCFVLIIRSLLITFSAPTCLSALSITSNTLPNELHHKGTAGEQTRTQVTEERRRKNGSGGGEGKEARQHKVILTTAEK